MQPSHPSELRSTDFTDFFSALWDVPPFGWQEDLAGRVLEGAMSRSGQIPSLDEEVMATWPEAIALPTASGKTACMDIAVFALAAQASRLNSAQAISAPRRVFFVVDRRVIVDEAHERAKRLVAKLAQAEEGILKTVADNLRCVSRGEPVGSGDERPLAAHILRGGMYRSEAWARNPLQPTIVASTIDQIGSRLLFRGYGASSSTWPIYAGLIANDSLILLDEAHCAQPFLQTLRAVDRYRGWAEAPLGRCFHPVVMSATPPPGMRDVFEDRSVEGADPTHSLGKRQLAAKRAVLRQVPKAKGAKATGELSRALVEAAQRLQTEDRQAIVVFVNRVATARETSRLLRDGAADADVVLLTGRMRPVDKEVVAQRLRKLDLYSNRSCDRRLERPVIVVATQTLEVGADLDFDGLVTECASLDALRQRFGRLNRMGRSVESRAEILIRADQAEPKRGDEDDPIYGRALTETWKWLNEQKDENGELDFGIARLGDQLPAGEHLAKLNAPSVDAPVMFPAHVDCWAQTAPEPRPSPDVELFLRGPREGVADVQVCWRADIDLETEPRQNQALMSLRLCGPSSGETLPVPIGVFRRWLAGKGSEDESGDVEGVGIADEREEAVSAVEHDGGLPAAQSIVRWRGARTNLKDITSDPADIRPGNVVVVPTRHPGPFGQLGDLPPKALEVPALLDVGDQACRIARAKPMLRLHPALVEVWPNSIAAKTTARSLLTDLDRKHEEDPDEVADAVRGLLAELSAADPGLPDRWAWLPRAAKELKQEFANRSRLRRECRLVGGQSLVLAGRRRVPELTGEADGFADGDDAALSGISDTHGRPVLLRTHLAGVENLAGRHAKGCGLPDSLAGALACAGLLHDVGKVDPRFQALLRGGSPWVPGEPLAKSGEMARTRDARRRARSASRYPEGGRHELLSIRLAESVPRLLPNCGDLRALVLHLIACHHGHCRPFAPVVVDNESVDVAYKLEAADAHWCGPTDLERLDSGVANRYWRLTRRYGWWGLAWLEGLLRLADWQRSEWEENHDAGE